MMVERQLPTTAAQQNDWNLRQKAFTAEAERRLIVDQAGDIIDSANPFPVSTGFIDFAYDYVVLTNPNSTTDLWTFKTGGSGGTTVGTVTIVYTDTTKCTVDDVTKVKI